MSNGVRFFVYPLISQSLTATHIAATSLDALRIPVLASGAYKFFSPARIGCELSPVARVKFSLGFELRQRYKFFRECENGVPFTIFGKISPAQAFE